MKIIPAIDIIDGKCVRLEQGDFSKKKVYYDNPFEMAKLIEDAGLRYLHIVDLDGSKHGKIINYKSLEKICLNTNLHVDFGGGIKSDQDLRIAINSGVNQITLGSLAVQNENIVETWIEKYGPNRFILGADCLNKKIAINGWTTITEINLVEFIEKFQLAGIKEIICTDIAKDGMLLGPAIDLYKDIISDTNCNLIASGGIRSIRDLECLKEINCYGAIIGKAIYEKNILLSDLAKFINA